MFYFVWASSGTYMHILFFIYTVDKHTYICGNTYLHIIDKLHPDTEQIFKLITQIFVLGGNRTHDLTLRCPLITHYIYVSPYPSYVK